VKHKSGKKKRIYSLANVVVQKYIERTALLMGRKFDVQTFMVVLCCKPWFVFASPGYARVSLSHFATAGFGRKDCGILGQKLVHETGLAVQERSPYFCSLRVSSTLSLSDLQGDLVRQGLLQSGDHYHSEVFARMKEVMRLIFVKSKDKLGAKFGCFEIFSFDFVLSATDLRPWLVDITSNPSFATEMLGNGTLIKTLLRDVTYMARDVHEVGLKSTT